jgi:hypothetical protein
MTSVMLLRYVICFMLCYDRMSNRPFDSHFSHLGDASMPAESMFYEELENSET